jgi:hypothetical protein
MNRIERLHTLALGFIAAISTGPFLDDMRTKVNASERTPDVSSGILIGGPIGESNSTKSSTVTTEEEEVEAELTCDTAKSECRIIVVTFLVLQRFLIFVPWRGVVSFVGGAGSGSLSLEMYENIV